MAHCGRYQCHRDGRVSRLLLAVRHLARGHAAAEERNHALLPKGHLPQGGLRSRRR